MVRFLPFLISLALSVYALFSCIQTPEEDVPHLPKLVWIVLIVFVPFVGPIVWLLMLRAHLGRRDRAVRPPKPGQRPVAPDDDPDFLKSLDRYRDPRTTVAPPHDETPPQDDRPQDETPRPDETTPESAAEAGPDKPERKPKPKSQPKSQPKPQPKSQPKAEDETPSESDDGKA